MSSTTLPGRILEKGECWSDEPDSHFDFLAIAWTENSEFYLSKLPCRNSPSISLDDIDKSKATLIPKEHVYPLWREDITEAQSPLPSEKYARVLSPTMAHPAWSTWSTPRSTSWKYWWRNPIRTSVNTMGAFVMEITLQVSASRSINVRWEISSRVKFLLISKCTARCKLLSL